MGRRDSSNRTLGGELLLQPGSPVTPGRLGKVERWGIDEKLAGFEIGLVGGKEITESFVEDGRVEFGSGVTG